MDTFMVGSILRDAVLMVLKIGGPMLLLSMLIGVLVAIFQAVTQIHEQTLGFILKLVTIVTVLLIGGGWMLENLTEYARRMFELIGS